MKFTTEGNIITATFDGLAPVTFDAAAVNDAVATSARILGLSNKLRDSAAIPREQKVNGRVVVVTVTEAMRREKVAAMAEALAKPDATWELRAKAARPLIPALVALAEKTGRAYAELEAQFVADIEAQLSGDKTEE